MSVAALALTAAVLMHVSWNLLARASHPDSRFLWWALLGYLVVLGPYSLYALATQAHWSPRLAGLLVTSALGNCLYFLALGAAYRRAPVALVYPIARSSPLLIALWGSLLFGEVMPGMGWVGILVSVAGLLVMASSAWHGERRFVLLLAATAAFATSVYSLSNKFAVTSLPTYGSQLGLVSFDLIASASGRALHRQRLRAGDLRDAISVGGLRRGLHQCRHRARRTAVDLCVRRARARRDQTCRHLRDCLRARGIGAIGLIRSSAANDDATNRDDKKGLPTNIRLRTLMSNLGIQGANAKFPLHMRQHDLF